MSRFRQTLAAVLTAAILLTLSPAVAAWDNDTRSADVVSAALGEEIGRASCRERG